ncbi:hypothetical protein [Massilia oculi]|uniref:hypothetical protein n=1 Tax=Massilia oculi TaxID=945844 RepID=UPI0028A78CB1|nr:hypothetical protein [Massilia oculi]
MGRSAFLLAAAVATGAPAQAQLAESTPAPVELADTRPRSVFSAPRDPRFETFPRVYGGNLNANPNDRLFGGLFKTDPRLLMGVSVTPALAFEAGYVNVLDQGFRPVNERDPEDTTGAIGLRGFNLHAAAKVTKSLGDGLSAYGKLGVAHSENRRGVRRGVDTGLYTGVGARYKVSERVTLDGSFENHGHAAQRFQNATNSSSRVKANLSVGF